MDSQPSSSPPLATMEGLPAGFADLMRHNSADNANYSLPGSRYGTPAPQTQASQHQDVGLEAGYRPRGGEANDMQHGYQQQTSYPPVSSPYGPVPEVSCDSVFARLAELTRSFEPQQHYATPANSPPPSSHLSNSGSGGGSIIFKALGPKSTKIEKSTPKKKKERAKPMKNMPTLEKPLSELTKDSPVPIADIEAYVNRPAEVRRGEIETGKNPGRVKRPMNAFMLYRKAYQGRAKECVGQHNHQVVSKVCGLSWPLEPEHIRAQFKAWADMERDNHQKAHPNYKFTPAKPSKPPAPSDRAGYDGSEGSELDEMDWASGRDPTMRSATHTPGGDSDYMATGSLHAAAYAHSQHFAGMHAMGLLQHPRPTALDFHLAKPLSGVYGNRSLAGQYYDAHFGASPSQHLQHLQQQQQQQQDGLPSHHQQRTPSPSLAYSQHQHPSMHLHYQAHGQVHNTEHLQHQQQHAAHHHPASQQQHIDPLLMPHEDAAVLFDAAGHLNDSLPGLFDTTGLAGTAAITGAGTGTQHQPSWQQQQHQPAGASLTSAAVPGPSDSNSHFNQSFMAGLDETLSLEQHTQFLRGADEWQIEQLPETTHFDTSWVEPKGEV
ncbi:hypothetical protein VTJ83DRAFT_2056 [Remersonia thermophila]|uniref:HMG box domain-containing protein n=1 Tax=Remersonia thermophila TaxID=72144 RepID=A0ABR4DHN3_9PEZI